MYIRQDILHVIDLVYYVLDTRYYIYHYIALQHYILHTAKLENLGLRGLCGPRDEAALELPAGGAPGRLCLKPAFGGAGLPIICI